MKPMNKNTKNSCINDFDPSALDEVTAVKQILKSIAKIKESETINIMDSLGRVSSKNIKLMKIQKYFLKKINNTKIFNLDDETLLMEFEDRVLNG